MRRTFKRILATIMVVLLVLTSAPLQGFIEMEWSEINLPDISSWFVSKASAVTERYYTYMVNDGKATITDVETSISGDVTVPSTLGGYPVTVIGSSAFSYCIGLTSISFPDSITEISSYTFENCCNLKSVIIGDNVKTIGYSAFFNCTSLENIVLPEKLLHIGSYAFSGCKSIKSVNIPESVEAINAGAFENCEGLESLTIPDSMENIGGGAFNNCTNLKYLKIPASLDLSDTGCFGGVEGLEEVVISKGNGVMKDYNAYNQQYLPWYNSKKNLKKVTVDQGVKNIGDFVFYFNCSNLSVLNLPDSLERIGTASFLGCSSLNEISLPDSVTDIGGNAFYKTGFYNDINNWDNNFLYLDDCLLHCSDTDIVSCQIKPGTRVIAGSAFYDCSELTDVMLPDGLLTIGSSVFSGCMKLSSIVIPDSVTKIGSKAFSSCGELKRLEMPASLIVEHSDCFENTGNIEEIVLTKGNGSMADYSSKNYRNTPWFINREKLKSITVEDGLMKIGDYAFSDMSTLTEFVIPESVTEIGEYAFKSCSALSSLIIPDGVNTIGPFAFGYCSGLTEIIIPDGVSEIDDYTFYQCNSLSNVTIPVSVVSIGEAAFWNCTSLINITLPDTLQNISSLAFDNTGYYNNSSNWVDGYLYIGDYLIKADNTVTNICRPKEGTKLIAGSAFDGFSYTTEVYIPDTVIGIGDSAFSNCGIQSIVIPDGITRIEKKLFYSCSNLTDITLPKGLTSIGACAFEECTSLKKIDIPDGVTIIEQDVFIGCRELTDINIPDKITSIEQGVFSGCIKLESLTIPKSVTKIGTSAFYNCPSLKNITLPSKVSDIGEYAFAGCSALRNITIPEGITNIKDYTFYVCSNLTSITIPHAVSSIGYYAFNGCKNLKEVCYTGTQEKWNTINIDGGNDQLANSTIYYNYQPPVSGITNMSTENPSEPIIVITPEVVDNESGTNDVLSVVTAVTNSGSISFRDYCEIKRNEAVDINGKNNGKIIVKASDFRDYIIPNEVIKSIQSSSEMKNLYLEKVYMHPSADTDKPYISTVFGRTATDENIYEYEDVVMSDLTAFKGDKYDFIVSVGGLKPDEVISECVLLQNEDTKIISDTGIFDAIDLCSKFDSGETVYVYAETSIGRKTDVQKIKLGIVNNTIFDDESETGPTISLFGSEGQKIKLSNDIKFLKDAYLSLDGFKCPVGIEVEGSKIRVTLGFDGFSGSKKKGEKFKWKSFKETVNEQVQLFGNTVINPDKKKPKNFREAVEQIDNIILKYSDKEELNKLKKASKTSFDFNTKFLGYIEGEYVDGQIIYTEIQGVVSLSSEIGHTWPFSILGFPVYASLSGGVDADATLSKSREATDANEPMEFGCVFSIVPLVKGAFGAGVRKLAYAELNAKGSAPIVLNAVEKHLKVDFGATIGWAAGVWIFRAKGTIWKSGTRNLIDYYYGTSPQKLMKSYVRDFPSVAYVVDEPEFQIVSRDYLKETSQWLYGDASASMYSLRSKAVQQGVTFSDLQTSVFEGSDIKTAQAGNSTVAVWVEDAAERDEYNRMKLVYSVRNGDTGLWSEPKPVWDNGMNDGYPAIVESNGKIYITWQKINKVLTENDCADIQTLYTNGEICLAEYDLLQDKIVSAKYITDNNYYDFTPTIAINNGVPVVYWASCPENNMNDAESCNIERYSSGASAVIKSDINYPSYIVSGIIDGKESISYSADVDGDLETASDLTVVTVCDGKEYVFDKGNSLLAITSSKYGTLDGKTVLFMQDARNIYYKYGEEIKEVFEIDRQIEGNLNIVNAVNGTQLLWTEADENGINQIFSCVYSDGSWSVPVQITNNDKCISNLNAVSVNGKVVGICNRSAMIFDNETEQYTKAQTDICGFVTENLTDLEIEFSDYSEQSFLEGDNTFELVVRNHGTTDIDKIEFVISDSSGNINTVVKQGNLKSGAVDYIELEYDPGNYTKATVTVTADIVNDADKDNNSITFEIGKADLSLSYDTVIEYDEYYNISLNVADISLIDAEDAELLISSDEEGNDTLFTEELGVIKANEIKFIDFSLNKSALTFDEYGVTRIYIRVSCKNKESTLSNNSVCIPLVIVEEPECEHTMTNIINAKDVTCEENGYTGDTVCAGCGEKLSEGSVIETKGHNYLSVLTPSSCTSNGYTTYTCICGDSYVDDYVDMLKHSFTKRIIDSAYLKSEATTNSPAEYYYVCSMCSLKGDITYTYGDKLGLGQPENISATQTANTITLSWGAVDGATGYRVFVRQDNKWVQLVKATATTSCTLKNLSAGTKYTYAVRAYLIENGTVTWAPKYTTFTTATQPALIKKVTSTKQTATSITISWDKVNCGGYRVFQYNPATKKWDIAVKSTRNTTATITGLTEGKNYIFAVRPYVNTGTEIIWAKTYTKVTTSTMLSKITLKVLSSAKGRATIAWGKAAGATGYQVYYSTSPTSGYKKIANYTNNSTYQYNLTSGTTYYYRARAYKAIGGSYVYGGWSDVVSVKIK